MRTSMWNALSNNKCIEDDSCGIWWVECANHEICIEKNKKKIKAILELKRLFSNHEFGIIAMNLINEIENVFGVNDENASYKAYLLHFLNNWLWAFMDTLYFKCNNRSKKINKGLRLYILNIHRLKAILDKSKNLSADQKKAFLGILKDKCDSKKFGASLADLLKILNSISEVP